MTALLTDVGLDLLIQHLGGGSAVVLTSFRIGEGGFVDLGGLKIPKTPDGTEERLEADGTALTGTVTMTASDPNVTGAGTAFLSEVTAGQYIRLDADLVWAEVDTVLTDTTLTLVDPYAGTGGAGAGSVNDADLFVFPKALVSVDLTLVDPGEMDVTLFLDFNEANDDGSGNNPEFFEVGLMDANDNLIGYATFPKETKTAELQLDKTAELRLTRPA